MPAWRGHPEDMPDPAPPPHPGIAGSAAVVYGILANLLLALIKGAAGVLGHSYALIADAIESLADVLTSAIVWFGLRAAARGPDQDHPYGHGKAEPIAALAVSLMLAAAAVLIAVQSVRQIRTPHEAPAGFTLLVLLGVILVKELLYRYLHRIGRELQSGALQADAWHHRGDALTSLAAGIGISVALIGGPAYAAADDWAALAAAGLIAWNAARIFLPAFNELMDRAPADVWIASVCDTAAAVDGVMLIERCQIRKMGFDYFADLHVHVDGNLSVREGHIIAGKVKSRIRQAYPRVRNVLIHIEPAQSGTDG